MNKNSDCSVIGHRFERLGFKAPFIFDRFELSKYQAHQDAPVQPGTCCDYCGTGISNVFWIKDAEGKSFKVGSDCVKHLDDKNLVVIVESEVRKLRREQRLERERQKYSELLPLFEKALVVLKVFPHPNQYFASKGKTLADYYEYISRSIPNMKIAISRANEVGGGL